MKRILDFWRKTIVIRKQNFIHKTVIIKNISQIKIGICNKIMEYVIINCSDNRNIITQIGNNVIIKPKVHISGNVTISDYCGIGHNCWIGGKGEVFIDSNTLIGMNTLIISDNHDYKNPSFPFYCSDYIVNNIRIGKNVWIGGNCTILPGCTIGDNCVIGAGSIVKGEIPPNSFVHPELSKINSN